MKPHPLLLLVSAACVHSWPQIFDNGLLPREANPARLPVVDDDIDLVTLPVVKRPGRKGKGKQRDRRQLPVGEDLDMSAMTLPVSGRDLGNTARKEARQFLQVDAEVPSLHSSGPGGSKRADKTKRQFPVDEDLDMSAMTLPVSSGAKGRGKKQARQLFNDASEPRDVPSLQSSNPDQKRAVKLSKQLPVDEDLGMSAMTLPVSHSRTMAKRADPEARQLPNDNNSPGVLTLPVVRSTKPGLWKRAVEVELANRSDVAYYAQRKLHFVLPSSFS